VLRARFIPKEDMLISKYFKKWGTDWERISREILPHRSGVMLKNRFYSFIRKNDLLKYFCNECKRHEAENSGIELKINGKEEVQSQNPDMLKIHYDNLLKMHGGNSEKMENESGGAESLDTSLSEIKDLKQKMKDAMENLKSMGQQIDNTN